MKRTVALAGFVLVFASCACPQRFASDSPRARNEPEKRILTVLDGIVKAHKTYLSVPEEDGRALRLLAEAAGAKNVVEFGTSTGYSGLWFCLALRATGGHLTTFELDRGRAAMARGHFRDAGVEDLVTIVEGDAHRNGAALPASIDVAFLDADKGGYVDYLNKVLPRLRPGGLILAHNIDMTPEYLRAVTTNPQLETILYHEGGGLSITVKKR